MQTDQSQNLTQFVEDLSKQLHGCLEKILVDPTQSRDDIEDSKCKRFFISFLIITTIALHSIHY